MVVVVVVAVQAGATRPGPADTKCLGGWLGGWVGPSLRGGACGGVPEGVVVARHLPPARVHARTVRQRAALWGGM